MQGTQIDMALENPRATDLDHLVQIIAEKVSSPEVTIELWTKEEVVSQRHSNHAAADVETRSNTFADTSALVFYVRRLVDEGTPFVTSAESAGQSCVLRWTLVPF